MTSKNMPRNKKLTTGGGAGGKKSGNAKIKAGSNKKSNKQKAASKLVGGYGPYPGVKRSEVNSLVDGQIRREVKGLKRDRKALKRDARKERKVARNDYQRALGDLGYIYGETRDYTEARNRDVLAGYDDAMGKNDAAGAALRQSLGASYTGAKEAANAELARLGIQQGASMSGMDRDLSFLQGMGDTNTANQAANLNLSRANAGAVGNLMSSMVQGSHMSQRGQARNALDDALFDIRQNRQDQMAALNDAITDVRGSRSDLFQQTLQQLSQTGWGQFMDLQNLRLQRQQMNAYNGANRSSGGTSGRRSSSPSRSSSRSQGSSSKGSSSKSQASGNLLKRLVQGGAAGVFQ